MNYIINIILSGYILASSLFTQAWPTRMNANGMHFDLATRANKKAFHDIGEMYELKDTELDDELKSTTFYCIYDENKQAIGAILIDTYSSLDQLKVQVSNAPIAKKIYQQGKTLELSYALREDYRGKGLGSKAVKAWVNEIKKQPHADSLFAVVDAENTASIKILENGA